MMMLKTLSGCLMLLSLSQQLVVLGAPLPRCRYINYGVRYPSQLDMSNLFPYKTITKCLYITQVESRGSLKIKEIDGFQVELSRAETEDIKPRLLWLGGFPCPASCQVIWNGKVYYAEHTYEEDKVFTEPRY